MTKLEQKLIQLGYEKRIVDSKNDNFHEQFYIKHFMKAFILKVYLKPSIIGILYPGVHILEQSHIDNLQQAFNQLQSDLKELKEYE